MEVADLAPFESPAPKVRLSSTQLKRLRRELKTAPRAANDSHRWVSANTKVRQQQRRKRQKAQRIARRVGR